MSALRQREPRYENRALLDLCYQIPCTADWPHDCGPSEPAHSNQAKHGKGKSLKAHDCFVAAICRNAHRELDQGKWFDRDTKEVYWQRAFEKTLLELWRRGLLCPTPRNVGDLRRIQVLGYETAGDGGGGFFELDPPHRRLPDNNGLIKPTRKRRTKTGHQNGSSTRRPSKVMPRGGNFA